MPTVEELGVSEIQEVFFMFDNKGDEMIGISQVGDVLRALGYNPTEAEVKKVCLNLKPNVRVSFEMFLPILKTVKKKTSTDTLEDFVEGLRHFDKDGNGFISSAELRHLLTTLGEKLTEDEVEQLLAGHEDSQGNVNYEEFVKVVMMG